MILHHKWCCFTQLMSKGDLCGADSLTLIIAVLGLPADLHDVWLLSPAPQSGWERETSWGRIRHVKEQKPELMLADGAAWPCTSWVCRREDPLLSGRPETEGEMTEDSERKRPKNRGLDWNLRSGWQSPTSQSWQASTDCIQGEEAEWWRRATRPPPHHDGKH